MIQQQLRNLILDKHSFKKNIDRMFRQVRSVQMCSHDTGSTFFPKQK